MSLRSLGAGLRRYGWIIVAGLGLLAALLTFGRRRRRSIRAGASGALRRAHEADVEATIAKARIERDGEEEIKEIRSELFENLGRIEADKVDHAAKLAIGGDELLAVYRRRAFELDLRDQ